MGTCTFIPMTAARPGAIGIIQLHGDVVPVLAGLTGRDDWPLGRLRLVRFGSIDEGLAGRITGETAQLMPHGGPRVRQRLCDALAALGATSCDGVAAAPVVLYPETIDRIEALTMLTLARAASPLAIDLLLDQPRRWRERPAFDAADEARSHRLNRLVDPPTVVVAGPPNVGKSTLSNALVGRSMSIAHDAPGTTRDYTVSRVDLGGLVVHWHDTPGVRATDDPIESEAIDLAARLLAGADLLVAMTDAEHDWPELPRPADLRLAGRCDLGRRDDADLSVSATTGTGLAELVQGVRDRLVGPDDLAHPGPWRFDTRLDEAVPAPSSRR